MKIKFVSILAIASVLIISCKKEVKQASNKVEEVVIPVQTEKKEAAKKGWAYKGETNPKHWKELAGDAACGGQVQSPINIITSDAINGISGLKLSDIHYQKETIINHVINNGHSIEYVFEGGENYVIVKGKRYDLAQFHFHAMSEHAIDGVHYPLVKHMVHVSKDNEYVVFAVLFKEGKENKSFNFLESFLPIKQGEKKAIGKVYDFTKDLPSTFDHFAYTGSLTTPPCTEGVNWFIFTQPEILSSSEVKALADLMPLNNFRPIQPLNGRKIILNK